VEQISVKTDRFQFDIFLETILGFITSGVPEDIHPSSYIMIVDDENNSYWGQEEGRNNFLGELSEGQSLFFPFSWTNVGEPIKCADGESYEIDEDGEFGLTEVDCVGFRVQLDSGSFAIQTAVSTGGGHSESPCVVIEEDCDVFDKPMKLFIDRFIIK
jgi:hypothetical protein